MPARRKAAVEAVAELAVAEPVVIESVSKPEVDESIKPLLESVSAPEEPEQPSVSEEEHLRQLMAKMLQARERAQAARERVREINSDLTERSTTMSDKIKDKYHKALEELTQSRRALNLTRAELFAALRGWNRSYRVA